MTVWLAGGGIRGGIVYGATDDLGYAAVENVCNVHDLHATMLHQLGIRPRRLQREVPGTRCQAHRRRRRPRHPRLMNAQS